MADADAHDPPELLRRLVAVGIVQHSGRGQLAVEINVHPLGPLRTVVGQHEMQGLSGSEGFDRFQGSHPGDPAGNDMKAKMPFVKLDEHAVAPRCRKFVRQDRAAVGLLRPDPERDGKPSVANQIRYLFQFLPFGPVGLIGTGVMVGQAGGNDRRSQPFGIGRTLPTPLLAIDLESRPSQRLSPFIHLPGQRGESLLLPFGGCRDPRLRIAEFDSPSRLRHIVEIGNQLVIFLLADRIEFVVVTAGASCRHPHPDRRCRVDSIHGVFQ